MFTSRARTPIVLDDLRYPRSGGGYRPTKHGKEKLRERKSSWQRKVNTNQPYTTDATSVRRVLFILVSAFPVVIIKHRVSFNNFYFLSLDRCSRGLPFASAVKVNRNMPHSLKDTDFTC